MAIPPGFSRVVGLGMERAGFNTDDEGGREREGGDETLALRAPSVPIFIPKQVELPRADYGILRQYYSQLTLRLEKMC